MKLFNFFGIIIILFLHVNCNSSSNSEQEAKSDPGPVSEMDKNRYNLNSSDELIYGTTDSLLSDSLNTDTGK